MDKNDISKLPKLDCIAAQCYDKLSNYMETEMGISEEQFIEVVNGYTAQIKGKYRRNEHSFTLMFTDGSVLKCEFMDDMIGLSIGQFHDTDKPFVEIQSDIPYQPMTNTRH